MGNGESPPPGRVAATPDYVLLAVGVVLLLIPLLFIVIAYGSVGVAELYLRIIAAIGGALIGVSLPGFLHVEFPFARAGGAMAIFLVIYAVNPPTSVLNAIDSSAMEEMPSSDTAPGTAGTPGADPAPEPTRPPASGWVYLGTFEGGRWTESYAEVPDRLPAVGTKLPVKAELNIRQSPPSFPFYKPGNVDGLAKPGDLAEVLELDELGRNRIWARVTVRPDGEG